MRSDSMFGFDLLLFFSVLILMVIGILFVFSSGVTAEGVVFSNEYLKQILWVVSGLVLMVTISAIDYARIRDLVPFIYAISIALLIVTMLIGRVVHGSRSWLGIGDLGIQPAEFMKLSTILLLASILESRRRQVRELSTVFIAMAVVGLPMLLILMQPDLGTTLVFIPIFFFMLFAAGARLRYLVFLSLAGLLMVLFTFLPAYETYIINRQIPLLAVLRHRPLMLAVSAAAALILAISCIGYFTTRKTSFYWIGFFSLVVVLAIFGAYGIRNILRDYQIMRLVVFLDPQVDPRGAGWNIIQSITAVGSGGFSGKGFLQGTQSNYRFLPQQSTDFIFSIIAEEWGFLGGIVIFLLFFTVLYRSLAIMSLAKDGFAAFSAAGITGMIFFHFIINVGMAIGIMPITGIPLFFLSYGGSSLWTVLMSVGFLMSFYLRRYRY